MSGEGGGDRWLGDSRVRPYVGFELVCLVQSQFDHSVRLPALLKALLLQTTKVEGDTPFEW